MLVTHGMQARTRYNHRFGLAIDEVSDLPGKVLDHDGYLFGNSLLMSIYKKVWRSLQIVLLLFSNLINFILIPGNATLMSYFAVILPLISNTPLATDLLVRFIFLHTRWGWEN